MSSNFLDKRAQMLGWDDHLYIAAAPNGAPIPIPGHPHGVYAHYGSKDNGKHTTTVTSEGELMLPADWEKAGFPHLPLLFPLPHPPLEAALLAWFTIKATSKSRMKASTVTGQGRALTCCMRGPVGWSANCSGSGAIHQSNSVVTSPTPGDYVEALYAYGVDKLIGQFFDGVPEPLKSVLEKLTDPLKDKVIEWSAEEARKYVDDFILPTLEKVVDELL